MTCRRPRSSWRRHPKGSRCPRRRPADPSLPLDRRGRGDQRRLALGRPGPRGDDPRATGTATSTAPRRSIGGSRSPTGSSPPRSTRTRCRPRPPAALGLPVGQCRLPNAPAPADLDAAGPFDHRPVGAPPTRRSGRLPDRRPDRARRGAGGPTAEADAAPVRLVFLGGLGEIGRNCACVEVEGRILVLDVGIMFPDPDMPGVDLVLPDFTYLRENAGGSTASSSPTVTRTTPAGSPTCSAISRSRSTGPS